MFQYPYAKVFRKTQRTLSGWGMKIKNVDAMKGLIQAESGFSLLKPSFKVDLFIEEMENHDTKITIRDLTVKKGLFNKKVSDPETREIELLESLSVHF